MSSKPSKKKHKRNRKKEKILIISGLALGAIQLITTLIFIIMVHFVNVLPTSYKVLIDILLILFCMLTLILQRWKEPGIIGKVFAVIMSFIMIVGSVYINATYHALDKIAGNKTQTTVMGVYVLDESAYTAIEELAGGSIGVVSADAESNKAAVEKINQDTKSTVTTTDYDGTTSLVDALYNGTEKAVVFNTSYADIFTELEKYSDFETKTRLLCTYEIVTDVTHNANNSDYLSGDNVFTMYISGIDVDGSPSENRNSDVNILCTVNTDTHQILLINTPRDFYVPTSVSGGVPDKLTHAGCYGIECSVETLEMLYEVNIDYYFKVNFTGFVDIINELGGVNVYSEYEFTSTHGGYYFKAGNNNMTGEQALGFARERYSFGTGDRQRGKNQMAVITAVIQKMTSSDMLMNYTKVLDAVSTSMITNMSYDEIGDFVKMQLKDMSGWDIQQYSVDGTGDNLACYSLSSPNYVMVPDETTVSQAKAYLAQIYAGQ